MSRRGWALFVAMCFLWGIPYLLIKVAVSDVSPVTLVFLRTLIGALMLLPLAAVRGNLRPLLPHWRVIVIYTAVEVAGPWFLISDAETRLSSSLTGLLIAAVPFVGVILGWLTGSKERFDPRRLLGLAVGFVGVAALVGFNVSARDFGAVGEVGLVAIGYAIGPMMIARRLSNVPALGIVAVSLALPAIAYAPLGLTHLPSGIPPLQVLVSVAVLGVVCTAIAFLVFFALIAEVGNVRATTALYVNPAVALALGVVLLGEPFTIGAVVGFGLILVGLFLATRRGPAAGSLPVAAHVEDQVADASG